MLSLNSFDCGRTSVASLRDANHGDAEVHAHPNNLPHPKDADSRTKLDGPHSEVQPVFIDEISSSANESSGREDGLLDNCGILSNNCLPCLASTVAPVEKRRSLSDNSPSARKKAALKLPFKWREGNPNAALRKFLCLPFSPCGLVASLQCLCMCIHK